MVEEFTGFTYHGNKRCQECKCQKTMAGHRNYDTNQQPENISTKSINAKTTDGWCYCRDKVYQAAHHSTRQLNLMDWIYQKMHFTNAG